MVRKLCRRYTIKYGDEPRSTVVHATGTEEAVKRYCKMNNLPEAKRTGKNWYEVNSVTLFVGLQFGYGSKRGDE